MPIVAANLVLGPCNLYVGPFGAAEPPDSAITPSPQPPGSPWVDVGGTDGGVTWEMDLTYTDLEVDQETIAVGSRLTGTKMQVTAKLAEVTLSNLQVAINQIGAYAQGDGYATLDIPVGVTSTQPTYSALLIDGWAPTLTNGMPARRRIIVRKVLSQPKASLVYDKKSQDAYDCTWAAYYISSSVDICHIVDQLA